MRSIEERAMRRLTAVMSGLILGTVFILACAQPANAQAPLEGVWTATRAERDGKAANDLVGHRLSFTGNRFEIRSKDGRTLYAGPVRIDARAKPAAIDFDNTEKDLKGLWKGIYALKGETLTICDNAPNMSKDRPTTFETRAGSGYLCVTFVGAK
jgi:uncharacterized protein (TIGR03067 family)